MINPNSKLSERFKPKKNKQPQRQRQIQRQIQRQPQRQPQPQRQSKIIDTAQPTLYPWTNQYGPQQINGYYMWANNFVNSSPAIQFCANDVYSKQTLPSSPGQSTDSYINMTNYQYTYPSSPYSVPSTDINSVFFFTGYSNFATSLSVAIDGGMYDGVINSMTNVSGLSSIPGGSTVLVGLVLGGATLNGGWSPGSSGAIYSCYEAFTTLGEPFSYTETGTGNTLTGTGTGIYASSTYSLNCVVFDIETWGSNGGSTGQDFLNLFTYIKTNANSVVVDIGIIIIVTIAHSCSNFNGTGQSVCSTIMMNKTPSSGMSNPQYTWDYISPQMYTQNIGTMNEYVANNNIYWTGTDSFVSYILENENFTTYGPNLLLPSTYNYSLYTTGGTNAGNPPNIYFYQSSPNNINPIVQSSIEAISIPYSSDTGLVDFFSSIFTGSTGSYSNLGGCVSWLCGTLGSMPTTAPTTLPESGSYIWLDSNNNYWALYVGGPSSDMTTGSPYNNPIYIPIGTAYNTAICQVYGAGGGGGGGGVNTQATSTGIYGAGGGGGAGSYCCFAVASSEPLNGYINLYVPSGGGGGQSNSDPGTGGTGGNGGGGGKDGNGAGALTTTYFQNPTSMWWNSSLLNGAYIMAACAPSGIGGSGFSGTNFVDEYFGSNAAFVNLAINQVLQAFGATSITQILDAIVEIATFGTVTVSNANLATLANDLLVLYNIAGIFEATPLAGDVDAPGVATTNISQAAAAYAIVNAMNTYAQSNQGPNAVATSPNLFNVGTPYASGSLNNFNPVQSGASSQDSYTTVVQQTSDGCVVNQFYNNDINPLNLGCGGSGGNISNDGSPGSPGAVIITILNASPSNSI
jgi:hypothetical protein